MKNFETFYESVYKYTNPQSVKFLLFDFYMLSYLNHVVSKDHHRINDNEIDLVQDAYKTNIDILTKHMLQGVYYAIVREMRHIGNSDVFIDDDMSKSIDQKYRYLYDKYFDKVLSLAQRVQKTPLDNTLSRQISKHLQNIGMSKVEIVTLAQLIFKYGGWDPLYGGAPWVDICSGWKKLYYSKTYKDKAVYIDHLYDLQHNSGSVLDKIGVYRGEWLKLALDFKRDIHNFKDIIPYISPKLRKHSLRILQKIGHIPPSPPRQMSLTVEHQREAIINFLKNKGVVISSPKTFKPYIEGVTSIIDQYYITDQSEIFQIWKKLIINSIDYIFENENELKYVRTLPSNAKDLMIKFFDNYYTPILYITVKFIIGKKITVNFGIDGHFSNTKPLPNSIKRVVNGYEFVLRSNIDLFDGSHIFKGHREINGLAFMQKYDSTMINSANEISKEVISKYNEAVNFFKTISLR